MTELSLNKHLLFSPTLLTSLSSCLLFLVSTETIPPITLSKLQQQQKVYNQDNLRHSETHLSPKIELFFFNRECQLDISRKEPHAKGRRDVMEQRDSEVRCTAPILPSTLGDICNVHLQLRYPKWLHNFFMSKITCSTPSWLTFPKQADPEQTH